MPIKRRISSESGVEKRESANQEAIKAIRKIDRSRYVDANVEGARSGVISENDAIGMFLAKNPDLFLRDEKSLFDGAEPRLPQIESVFRLYMKHFRGDLFEPKKRFAKKAMEIIISELELDKKDCKARLAFIPTGQEKTKLDSRGIDGVYVLLTDDDEISFTTFDISNKKAEDKGRKSDKHFDTRYYPTDLIIEKIPDPDLEPERFEEEATDWGKRLAGFLMRRMAQKGIRI